MRVAFRRGVRVALVLSVAACAAPSSGPQARLADLHATTLSVIVQESGWMGARLDTHADSCPALDRDANPADNGPSVRVPDSEPDEDGTGQPAQFAAPCSSVGHFVTAEPAVTVTV